MRTAFEILIEDKCKYKQKGKCKQKSVVFVVVFLRKKIKLPFFWPRCLICMVFVVAVFSLLLRGGMGERRGTEGQLAWGTVGLK